MLESPYHLASHVRIMKHSTSVQSQQEGGSLEPTPAFTEHPAFDTASSRYGRELDGIFLYCKAAGVRIVLPKTTSADISSFTNTCGLSPTLTWIPLSQLHFTVTGNYIGPGILVAIMLLNRLALAGIRWQTYCVRLPVRASRSPIGSRRFDSCLGH